MNCPKCNTEMEQGYLRTGQRLLWSLKKRGSILGINSELVLFPHHLLFGTAASTHRCPNCKILLTQYSDEDIR
jgi:hypothetical protein